MGKRGEGIHQRSARVLHESVPVQWVGQRCRKRTSTGLGAKRASRGAGAKPAAAAAAAAAEPASASVTLKAKGGLEAGTRVSVQGRTW